ncbi:hypothetical protein [Streptomyces olivaceoviridis]|uniref:hypothetical protein n=1 Tax=Streptomyces olivaceoviridis TaxID=1921 RepID=UPI0036FE5A1A
MTNPQNPLSKPNQPDTTDTSMTNPRPAPRALSLYPRRYRAEYGAEITQLYEDATDGADTRSRRREERDIAAHALRVRTALTSHQPLGGFALTAAPYALAAAVSLAATRLTATAADVLRGADTAALPSVGALVLFLSTSAAGALACAGRWPLARVSSTLSIGLLVVLLAAHGHAPAWLLPLLAVVALMPPATEPARTDRRLALAFAVLTWLPAFGAALAGTQTPGLGMVGGLGPVMVVLALRSAARGCRPHHILAVLFAGVPWAGPAGSPIGLGIVAAALTLAWCAGRTIGTRRRVA